MGDDGAFALLTVRSYGRARGSPEQPDPSLAHPLGDWDPHQLLHSRGSGTHQDPTVWWIH